MITTSKSEGVFGPLKIGRKEKKFEKLFSFHCLVWGKSKGKKIERKVKRKTWVVMKKKFSFQIWEENEGKKLFFIVCQKRQIG